MSELTNFTEFRTSFENDPSLLNFIKPAIKQSNDKYIRSLIFIFRVLVKSNNIIEQLVKKNLLHEMFKFFGQFMNWYHRDNIVFMLQTLNIFVINPLTQKYISENLFVLNIIISCLKKENETIKGEAAIIIINILKQVKFNEQSVILNDTIMDALLMFILYAREDQ